MSTARLGEHGLEVPRYAISMGDFDQLSVRDGAGWVRMLEQVGFPMVWLPEIAGREAFTAAQLALEVTSRLIVGNGVARALERAPKAAAAAQATLTERYPGRYLLGLGVSGASRQRGMEPAPFMRAYLDDMDACRFAFADEGTRLPRVLGAYSAALTKLAATRADGLITVLVTPEHTRWARQVLGERPFLSVVQWVLPEPDADRARHLARQALAYYLGLPHQQAKFRRLGFSDQDFAPPGSEHLVDTMVAWGSTDRIAARLQSHFHAGADQVAVTVIGPPDADKRMRITRLAGALGLTVGGAAHYARGGVAPVVRLPTPLMDTWKGALEMDGKVLVISGGTSGVGLAVALQALDSDYRVFITGTRHDKLGSVLTEASTERLAGCVADTSDWPAVQSAVAQARERFGRIDAIIASAGRGARGDFESGDPAEWRTMVLTNVLGPALLVRAGLPALLESHGHVVLVGSVFGLKPTTGNLYSATKSAVAAMSESLRQQLVGTQVRVSAIHPGRIDTPWWPTGAVPPALDANSVAGAVHWVLSQPRDVDINEIVMRPLGQPH